MPVIKIYQLTYDFSRHQQIFVVRVFFASFVSLPSWGCFLTAELSGKIDAFLRRAHRYGLAANILTVSEL